MIAGATVRKRPVVLVLRTIFAQFWPVRFGGLHSTAYYCRCVFEFSKAWELEEASRLQFRTPFLEPESEAVHADEAA